MGPLSGLKIIEIAGMGPGPFAGMLFANMGANIIQIQRASKNKFSSLIPEDFDHLNKGRRILTLDLTQRSAQSLVLDLCRSSDMFFEGFRPGVMEKFGIGPTECLQVNPALIYGRLTGWGQTGPLAQTAGHDINYLALSGVLGHLGRESTPPQAPLNLLADFAGGSLSLIMGMLAAKLHAQSTGVGQVVDAAMVEGSAQLMTLFYGLKGAGLWNGQRGQNMFDGGCYFYDVFETSDGEFMAVGPLEPKFYNQLVAILGLENTDMCMQNPPSRWPELSIQLATIFASKTAKDWEEKFQGSDACVTRVLDMSSAPLDPHNKARQAFVGTDKHIRPAPAPKFSDTPTEFLIENETNIDKILSSWNMTAQHIEAYKTQDIFK